MAHEADPGDFERDAEARLDLQHAASRIALAIRWFDLARKSPDPRIAAEAAAAPGAICAPANETFRTTVWLYPMYSTRWQRFVLLRAGEDRVAYPLPDPALRERAVHRRYRGRHRARSTPYTFPRARSFSGWALHTAAWHGVTGWAEAGSAIGYLSGHMLPDYRGGVSVARGVGHSLRAESSGWFAMRPLDGVFMSRFGNDFLVYSQSRAGIYAGSGVGAQPGLLERQPDLRYARARIGPISVKQARGSRFAPAVLPAIRLRQRGSALRDATLRRGGAPFHDIRVGVWYAFTR